MRLCALLGIHSRSALKQLLTHRDMMEWRELYAVDPWDQDRADLRAGIIAAAAVSPYAKRGQAPRPVDFMPYVKRGPRRQTPEQIKEIATAIAVNWNKRCAELAEKKRKRASQCQQT